jgi:PKD repeat protein
MRSTHACIAFAVLLTLAACQGGGSTPNESPDARLTVLPGSGDAPLTVAFNASGSTDPGGAIASYEWDFDGDSTVDSTTTVATESHTYTTPGTYTARLRVIDYTGASDTAEIVITVTTGSGNQSPVAAVSATPTTGPATLTVNFDASASSDPDGSIATYEWDFETDGTYDATGPGATIAHNYPMAGTFTATVRVSDNATPAATATATAAITVTGIADVSSRAQAALQTLVAAQDAYRAANGEYAHSLATLHNGGADPSYIDAQMSTGDLGDIALRMIWVDPQHYIADAIAGRAGGPPTPGAAPPNVDFIPIAPEQAFLVDETGTVYDQPLDIAARTIAAVDASAEAAIERIAAAQSDFHAANGRYANSLAELGADLLDALPASGYVELHNYDAPGDDYQAEAIASTGVFPYHLYLADRGSITETTINDRARVKLLQLAQMQSAYATAHGEYAFYSFDLDPAEILFDWFHTEDPASIKLSLLTMDSSHYVAYAYGGPTDAADKGQAPYHTFWIDETGTILEDPSAFEALVSTALYARGRTWLQMLIDAENAYYGANGVYTDLASLQNPPGGQSPYIDAVMATGQLGPRTIIAVVPNGQTYTAFTRVDDGAGGYRTYSTDESGVIVDS